MGRPGVRADVWSVLTPVLVSERTIVERPHMGSQGIARILERVRRQEGQDLLEYGLLMTLIAIVALGAVETVGQTITTVFWNVIAAATSAV